MTMMLKYRALSLLEELLAYEALWDQPLSTVRSLSQKLNSYPNLLVSTMIEPNTIEDYKKNLLPIIRKLSNFGVRIYGDGEFPERLNDARYPIKIFYYQGNWE